MKTKFSQRVFIFCLFSLCVNALTQTSRGGSVDYSGYDAQFISETSPGSYDQLETGSYISLGTFDLSGAFSFNLIGTPSFASWENISEFYTEYGSTDIFSESGFGVFFGNATTSGIEGVPLYIVGFDSTNPFLSQKMAIVGGGADWVGPSDSPPNNSTTIDIGVGNPTVFFGALTDIQGYGGLGTGFDISLSVVPEPSTMSAVVMSIAIVTILVVSRRLKIRRHITAN